MRLSWGSFLFSLNMDAQHHICQISTGHICMGLFGILPVPLMNGSILPPIPPAGNKFSSFSFIWECPSFTFIPKGHFLLIQNPGMTVFFQHLRNVITLIGIVSDEESSHSNHYSPINIVLFSSDFQEFWRGEGSSVFSSLIMMCLVMAFFVLILFGFT